MSCTANCPLQSGWQWIRKLEGKETLKIMLNDFVGITMHSLLPSMLCTISMICGIETFSVMWIMVIATAYVGHRQERNEFKQHGLQSTRTWIRITTLLIIILGASIGSYPSPDMIFPYTGYVFDNVLNFIILLPYFQMKVCQQVALYRIYLGLFGATTVSLGEKKDSRMNEQKMKLEVPKPATVLDQSTKNEQESGDTAKLNEEMEAKELHASSMKDAAGDGANNPTVELMEISKFLETNEGENEKQEPVKINFSESVTFQEDTTFIQDQESKKNFDCMESNEPK